MLHPYQILFPLFSLFLCRVDLTDLVPLHLPIKIEQVLDGDTLLVSHGSYSFKVRLSKIDAPEMGQPFMKGGDAGKRSKQCLKNLLKNRSDFTLKMERHDIYGRILGDVGELNHLLVANGCSGLYPHAQFESRQEKMLFVRTMESAKRRRVGLWASGGYRQPKLWRRTSKRSAHRR